MTFVPFAERHGRQFKCGNCGAMFASKSAKRQHKQICAHGSAENQHGEDEPCDDADLYGRNHSTPEVRARAHAEWAAMDWRGRLPDGWEYRP
jgi:hypothetical protein